jgi:hypothetical protein
MSAEQLHDDGGAEHEDDLKQSMRREDSVERGHLKNSLRLCRGN